MAVLSLLASSFSEGLSLYHLTPSQSLSLDLQSWRGKGAIADEEIKGDLPRRRKGFDLEQKEQVDGARGQLLRGHIVNLDFIYFLLYW